MVVTSAEGARTGPHLGYVDLAGASSPAQNQSYRVIPAGSDEVGRVPVDEAPSYHLDIDLQGFFSGDMPDLGSNEGMLTLQVDTLLPQDSTSTRVASHISRFTVDDRGYAQGFLTRGAFRRVKFERFVNLGINLIEVDGRFKDVFGDVAKVVKDSGLAEVDVLKGIPYLELGTRLIQSIVNTFGTKNTNDTLWSEEPILEIHPIVNSAYLRTGIYVVFDRDTPDAAFPENLSFRNNKIEREGELLGVTHLILGLRVLPLPTL